MCIHLRFLSVFFFRRLLITMRTKNSPKHIWQLELRPSHVVFVWTTDEEQKDKWRAGSIVSRVDSEPNQYRVDFGSDYESSFLDLQEDIWTEQVTSPEVPEGRPKRLRKTTKKRRRPHEPEGPINKKRRVDAQGCLAAQPDVHECMDVNADDSDILMPVLMPGPMPVQPHAPPFPQVWRVLCLRIYDLQLFGVCATAALERPQQLPSGAAERAGAADRAGAATRRLHIHLCKRTGSGYVVDWVNTFSVPLSCVLRVVARGWLCNAGEVRMPEEVRREVRAMLMAEEEGHTCLRRALGSIGRGDFTEGKALLQRAYFCGCALAHMQCIWAALWSVKGQPDKALQSLKDAVRAGLDWNELVPRPPTRPTAPVAQAPHTPAAGSPAMAPSAGSSSGPDIPEGPAPAPVDDVRLLPGLLEHLGSIRGHPDFTDLAQRATSGALPWAPAERVLGFAVEDDDAEDDDLPAPDARVKSRSGTRVSGARVSGGLVWFGSRRVSGGSGASGGSGTRVSGPSGKPHPTPWKSTRCPRQ